MFKSYLCYILLLIAFSKERKIKRRSLKKKKPFQGYCRYDEWGFQHYCQIEDKDYNSKTKKIEIRYYCKIDKKNDCIDLNDPEYLKNHSENKNKARPCKFFNFRYMGVSF